MFQVQGFDKDVVVMLEVVVYETLFLWKVSNYNVCAVVGASLCNLLNPKLHVIPYES